MTRNRTLPLAIDDLSMLVRRAFGAVSAGRFWVNVRDTPNLRSFFYRNTSSHLWASCLGCAHPWCNPQHAMIVKFGAQQHLPQKKEKI